MALRSGDSCSLALFLVHLLREGLHGQLPRPAPPLLRSVAMLGYTELIRAQSPVFLIAATNTSGESHGSPPRRGIGTVLGSDPGLQVREASAEPATPRPGVEVRAAAAADPEAPLPFGLVDGPEPIGHESRRRPDGGPRLRGERGILGRRHDAVDPVVDSTPVLAIAAGGVSLDHQGGMSCSRRGRRSGNQDETWYSVPSTWYTRSNGSQLEKSTSASDDDADGKADADARVLVRLFNVAEPGPTDDPDLEPDEMLVLAPSRARELGELLLEITS